jgi:hypothetical protein
MHSMITGLARRLSNGHGGASAYKYFWPVYASHHRLPPLFQSVLEPLSALALNFHQALVLQLFQMMRKRGSCSTKLSNDVAHHHTDTRSRMIHRRGLCTERREHIREPRDKSRAGLSCSIKNGV